MSSKRSAIGPQGDKGAVNDFGMASTPDEKPQRATAAQMANRRIKDVKKRRPLSSSSSFGAPQQSTPFSSLDPNTVSSFSSSLSQPPTNGFTFGQSQSFPGAGSNPAQPTQNGSTPFAFGSGGAASSFNFGSSFSSGSSTPNPFANMSTGGANQPPSGNSFGGFSGNLFSLGSSGTQGSGQQPLPSTGLFGNATSGPSAPATPAATTSSFGQSSFGTAPSPSIFSQPTPGRPSSFTQATSGGDDFTMQTSPDTKDSKAAAKPSIFGTTPVPQPSFGTSTSFGTTTSGVSAPATAAASISFGAPSPKPPVNPFQPSNPFQSATPEISEEAEKKGTASTAGGIFGGTPALASSQPPSSRNLFAPKPASSAATASSKEMAPSTGTPAFGASQPQSMGTLFGPKPVSTEQSPFKRTTSVPGTPLFGASQPMSAGNLFAPKPATSAEQALSKEAAPSSGSSLFSAKPAAEPVAQEKPTEISTGNPFSGLLAHKLATPDHSAAQKRPAAEETVATQSPFGNLFVPPTESPAKKAQPPIPNGVLASTAPLATTTEKPSTTTTEKAQAPTQPSFTKPTTTKRDPAHAFENLRPRKLPANLPKELEEDYILLFQIRTLNECFKREITKLDPAEDDFDRVIQFYIRVRETLSIPLGFRKSKRKTAEEPENVEESPSRKKVRPSGATSFGLDAAGTPSLSAGMKIGPGSITSTTSNSFGAEHPPSAGQKRKSVDEGDDHAASSAHREKRTKEASTTANAFAKSFSNSVTSESGGEFATIGTSKPPTFSPFKPSVASSATPSLFSTTPAASPAKSAPPTPPTIKDAAGTTPLFSQSAQKLTGSTPAGSSAAPAFQIPKFGSGTSGGTNFLSQFKKQADQHAEKEKEKRKAEDYDSEEDDEAEWERKDAEEQRKKRENLSSLSQRRSKFIPGKGFVFEDESTEASKPKDAEPKEAEPKGPEPEEADQSVSSASTESKSLFEIKGNAPIRENNIFGHLSPNPLFGARKELSGASTPTSVPTALSPGFSFGAPIPQGSSVLSSAAPSRSTTPGFTSDTGAEESVDGEDESLPQVEFARGGAGEENEDVILETRARALQFKDGNWDSQGVGFVRILKDRTTSRARILLRADPSGKVVLNTLLVKGLDYQLSGTAVVFMVPQAEGPPQKWAVRAKKGDVERLAQEMEAHKG